jgi:3-methyladenine DNA glycosylase AlkD
MTREEAMGRLRELGDEKLRQDHLRRGATGDLFGVKMGDVRTLAKEIKTDHKLAQELWATGNGEARLLACLIVRPKELSEEELDGMVRSVTWNQVADWLNSYVVKAHPAKEALRQRWMTDADPMAARSGWSLTAERVEKKPEGLDLLALLDRIERELADAPAAAQWTMNMTLAMIGIHHPELRERALAIGERLGVYRDFPVSKGCTSPFAPIWIGAMVERQG